MDKQLRQLHEFLSFYFAPWGAAKGNVWEDVIGGEVDSVNAQVIASEILAGFRVFTEEEIKLMQIVSS